MNRVFKAFAIAFAVVVALVSCKKEDQAKEVALTGIELNATTQALQVGQDFQLKVTYKPENATNKPEVTWASDAPAVATVDAGKVVAVAAGTAKITAKAGAFSATCTVTVTSAEEEIVPVEGNSAWSVIGAFLDSDWKKDYVCAEKDGAFVLKNVKLAKDNKVKFRKDKDWAVNRGINKENEAAELAADTPTKAIQGGGDIIIPADGIYDLYYFAEKEAIVYVAKDAALPEIPDFAEEAPKAPEVASWAEAEAAGAIHFFQFRAGANWSPKIYEDLEGDAEDFDNLTVANGVYTVSYEEGSNERWQSQFYMRPNPEKATLPLKAGKNYLVSLTFKANTTFGAFAKLTTYGDVAPKHEGARIKEWESVMLEANTEKTVAYVVEGVDCDNVNFVLDFGTHPENTTVEISNVKLEETDLPVGPVGDDTSGPIDINWDYTPSAEYLAESNLWKAVDGDKVGFYYIYEAAGYPAAASDSYELLSFKESTYVLDCKAATESTWANQLFIYPKEGSFIALDPAKTYKVKITVCSNADYYGPFIKLCTYNPETANHEGAEMWALTGWPELITFKAGEPIIKEVELTGKEAQNIIWVMGLGGNPKDAKIYIKDIIVEEVGGDVPPVVDAPESDVITVDILPTAYPSEETVVKNGDIEYNILLVANYGNGIQMKKQDSYISNKTAFKNIKTIKVTTATSKTLYPENLKLCAGTSENPTTEIPMKSGDSETAVWELDGEYTYFKLQNVSGYAVYLSKIEINPASDPVASTPTDLSSLKANCYVISEAGSYKIPAVKGNSNESVGTVASAAIIWETYNSGAAVTANSVIAKVGVNDGFIVFETPATLTPGNALIAALDASENILWSWHIWIPKNAITSSQFGLGGQTLMDRNLGALEVAVAGAITPESQGMLYSWGRKDPFLGNAVIGEKASYAVAEGQASVTIGASGVLMTVAESIKNPTTFVQTGSDDNKDWCSESDVAATLWGETKTMYDPCPAGYQVPYNPWDDAKNGIWNLKADDAILTTLGFSKNADQHWFQMGDPATVFPICGYLDQDGYKNRGARAYYWSARSTGTGIANVIRVDSSNNKVTDERKSRAGNIRCVVSE